MRRRLIGGGLIAVLAVLLSGCIPPVVPSEPQLVCKVVDGQTVAFRVLGGDAVRYEWVFGDGQTASTTAPSIEHRYAAPGVYVVVVEGYGRGGQGTGAPGPAPVDTERLVFRLQAVVDTRPALEIVGIQVEPVDPPNWYAPGTPAWPDWHYPACIALRFRLLTKTNRPGEIGIVDVDWKIFNAYGQLLEDRQAIEWIWYEAMNEFVVYGCPGGPTEYRVYVAVSLSDGSVISRTQSIWACPSGGCR